MSLRVVCEPAHIARDNLIACLLMIPFPCHTKFPTACSGFSDNMRQIDGFIVSKGLFVNLKHGTQKVGTHQIIGPPIGRRPNQNARLRQMHPRGTSEFPSQDI
jgi:hypothetical protein